MQNRIMMDDGNRVTQSDMKSFKDDNSVKLNYVERNIDVTLFVILLSFFLT